MSLQNKHKILDNKDSKNNEPRKNILSRIKASFLLLVIFVSIITTLPILQTTNASALSTSPDDPRISVYEDQITSYLYYKLITECMNEDTLSKTNLNIIMYPDALGGSWFKGRQIVPGVYMQNAIQGMKDSGSLGMGYCSNASLITNALGFWSRTGATGMDPISVLCNSNFEHSDQSDCFKTIDQSDTKNYNSLTSGAFKRKGSPSESAASFAAYIRQQVYNNQEPPSMSDAQLYIFYIHTLNEGCTTNSTDTDRLPGSTATPTSDTGYLWGVGSSGSTAVAAVKITSGVDNPAEVATGYITINDNDSAIKQDKHVWLGDTGNDGTTMSCGDIAVATTKYVKAYVDAYNKWAKDHKAESDAYANTVAAQQDKPGPSAVSTCDIQGVGWIVCPVVKFMASIADGSFKILSDNFLSTSTSIFTGTVPDSSGKNVNPTFEAWSAMRSIANVAFVIVFLIIIFSQITSVGITNYGIKKLLPRLIIAAILVNISYYICQIAVDLSNILGYSLQSFLTNLAPNSVHLVNNTTSLGSGSDHDWTSIAGLLLVGSIAWGSIGVLIPALLAAIVALIMILFILVARQALIVILIVISPLAFVSFLLPNTNAWYKKWQKTFTSMLMLFPIVAIVFGASSFASTVLTQVFDSTSSADHPSLGKIIAAVVLVLPLFVVPGLLKKSLDSVGSIGSKLNGLSDKWGQSVGNKYKDSDFNKWREKANTDKTAQIRSGTYGSLKNPFTWASGVRSSGNKVLNNIPGGYGDFRNKQMASSIAKMKKEEMDAASALTENLSLGSHLALAKGGSAGGFNAANNQAIKSASMEKVMKSGDHNSIKDLYDHIATSGSRSDQRALASAFGSASSKPSYIGGGAIESLRQGLNQDMSKLLRSDQLAIKAINDGSITTEKLASASKDELSYLHDIANDPANKTNNTDLKNSAQGAITNPQHTDSMGAAQKVILDAISKLP